MTGTDASPRPAFLAKVLLANPSIRMVPLFNRMTQSRNRGFTVLPPGVSETLSPASTHGLALVGIVGGVALAICVLWLLIVRTCQLKANVVSDGTSKSTPLLNPDRIQTNLQSDHVPMSGNGTLPCSVSTDMDLHQIFHDGIPEVILRPVPIASIYRSL
ncbi:hypothetical protein DFH29DRAFT_1072100 [Suillus ampliporus]|nr:hypothetical protein DFH29DRAFT_1072100 [Suillus ampliporus]